MSRFVRAWNELTGGRQSKSMLPSTPRTMSGNQIVSRDTVNPISPYESSSYNSPIGNTAAPPGSRQQWELHKVREESRNLFLRSPLWSAYIHFMRMQVRGFKPTRLRFRRMTREQKGRLKDVCTFLRQDWDMFQSIRGVFGTGRNIHQSAGNALHHMLVDGDCFLTNRLMAGKRVWDLHPGDSLYEQFNQNFGDGNYVQMGVEMDAHAMPLYYLFGTGGELAKLNYGWYAYGSAGVEVLRMPAQRVQHIMDLSGEVSATRGWPRCAPVVSDISRLDDWYSALVRGAISRASMAAVIEKAEPLGDPSAAKGKTNRGMAALAAIQGGAVEEAESRQSNMARRYQQFLANAGRLLELDAGYTFKPVPPGSASSQEANIIKSLERRVCSSLRISPATLLGDYGGVSFSAVQGLNLQDREAVLDMQYVLAKQFYEPIYRDRFNRSMVTLQGMFPELETEDFDLLRFPEIVARSYMIVDKQRLIRPLLEQFEAGMVTYAELRDELGYLASDPDAVIEQWKEDRRKLGLPEHPTRPGAPNAGGGSSEPPDDDDDRDGDDDSDDDGGE